MRGLSWAVFLAGVTLANTSPAAPPTTRERDARRLWTHQRRAMSVLTAWGAASVAGGATTLVAKRDDDFWLWGGAQHVLWGATNVVIGATSLAKSGRVDLSDPDAVARYGAAQERKMRRVYWINMALDVLYVGTGALLWTLAKPEGARGSGAAIVGQGGFLFAFDIGAAMTLPRMPR
jgi:hypothetical protein